MMDTDKKFCSILLDVIAAKGVKDVVCSPGSRNTPLLLAVSCRQDLRKHVVVDERSAAFMALGMSAVSRQPVALICTSGTALLNYGPAVAEAFYQSVPLIVISADRPRQWIDQDDSQTLRQFEAFSNYVKKSYELPAWGNDDEELQWYANRIANDAIIEATSRRKGPVHINVCLGEPLGQRKEWERPDQRLIEMICADSIANKEVVRELAMKLAKSKVMFVAGFLPPDSHMHRAAAEFCKLPNVVAMTETLSNLHIGNNSTSVDTVLTSYEEEKLDALAPDIVVSVGGALVSRKLKEYLRRNKRHCEHWALGWQMTTSDCFMSLTKRIEVEPSRLLHQLAIVAKKHVAGDCTGYSALWNAMRLRAEEVKNKFIDECGWSELKAFRLIFSNLPSDINIFFSNGTTVRYAQILCRNLPHASYCNRGVSGIDGTTSTAVGGAEIYKGRTLLITGDMSLSYDINGLGLPGIPDDMKIIVMNNGGGGIFRFIPTTSSLPEREEYFCVPSPHRFDDIMKAFGWRVIKATDEQELVRGLHELLDNAGKAVLEVCCPAEESASCLRKYMQIHVSE